ncbi:hypothetical protein Tco_0915967 [Tanacetum coccineum]
MSRRSKRNSKVPLKLIDIVYSINGNKSNKRNNTLESTSSEVNNGLDMNDDGCYDNMEDNGANMSQDKNKERSVEKDEVNEHSCSKMDSNCEHMSNVEANLKGNESSDQHAAKNRAQESNGGESDNSTHMDTAKLKSVSMNTNFPFHINHVNMDSYAKAVGSNNSDLDKNLFFVPTSINDNCGHVVIFEEESIRYNIRRMWSKYGLMEIQVDNNEILDSMRDKYSSSRLEKPIMMDSTTVNMCHKGIERTDYARFLVEMEANKGLPDKIEVVYKDIVFVERERSMQRKMELERKKGVSVNNGKEVDMEGFVEVINKKKLGNGNNAHMRYKNKEVIVSQKFQYRPKEKQRNVTNQEDSLKNNENQKKMEVDMEKKYDSLPSLEKLWRVNPETMNNIHKSANNMYVLKKDELKYEENN